MELAEEKAKSFKALASFMPMILLFNVIPGVLELGIGTFFAAQSHVVPACARHDTLGVFNAGPIVEWLVADGAWNLIANAIGWISTKKKLAAQSKSELHVYLLEKEHGGAVDAEKEAQVQDMEVQASHTLSLVTVSLLALGLYLYCSTASQSCDALPRACLGWLLVVRAFFPCISGLCVGRLLAKQMPVVAEATVSVGMLSFAPLGLHHSFDSTTVDTLVTTLAWLKWL
eukprot:gnl/TRDRNA2_/TRDRNA2_162765_c0_seq2.p1 gnl/TRDRNA2_/TRDRNA2_162765_c0~~gnl/TRDRNA2_/TRDRNA2_162765_c0_seq2.p1  ORF type:complete len:265 (+),score=38.81 gnl/TRDRNA2_/TRDRNA2_162765_c0_seq2:110-796(+)